MNLVNFGTTQTGLQLYATNVTALIKEEVKPLVRAQKDEFSYGQES